MLCARHCAFVRQLLGHYGIASKAPIAFRPCSSSPREGPGNSEQRSNSTNRTPPDSVDIVVGAQPEDSHSTQPKADLEIRPKNVPRSQRMVRQFETVTSLPNKRDPILPQKAKLMAKINDLFAKHPRTRAGFLLIVEEYTVMDKTRRGNAEFVLTAVAKMEEFGVEKDLDCYQRVLDCIPKGRYLPQQIIDEVITSAPPQTEAATLLLQKMDRNSVLPNYHLVETLAATLGWRSHPSVIALEIGWWKSMLQDNDPFFIPSVERYSPYIMAGFVLKRMAGKASSVQIVRGEPSTPDGRPWVLATQSQRQGRRAKSYERTDLPLTVEGPRLIYMRNVPHYYYVLCLDARLSDEDSDDPGEQTAIGTCITPTGCVESVSAWTDFIKAKYPLLQECQFIFNHRSIPASPYECIQDIPPPLPRKKFEHTEDKGKMPDETEISDRLLSDPF